MKPIIYMAIGALIPLAANELMNSKVCKDMMRKVKYMCQCKSKMEKEEDYQDQTTSG